MLSAVSCLYGLENFYAPPTSILYCLRLSVHLYNTTSQAMLTAYLCLLLKVILKDKDSFVFLSNLWDLYISGNL